MPTLLNPTDRTAILERLRHLTPSDQRRWGTLAWKHLDHHLRQFGR
ncbi:MAG: hypothetical protein ABI647_18005 [Gemmatimonadota bacterium]